MHDIIRLPWELKIALRLCKQASVNLTAFIKRGEGVWLNEGLQLRQQVHLAASQLIQVRDAITSCITTMQTMRRSDTRKVTGDRLNDIVQKLRDASALCVDGRAKLQRCFVEYKKEMTTMDVEPFISHTLVLLEAKNDYQALSTSVTKCCQMALDAHVTPLKAPNHPDTELLQLHALLERVRLGAPAAGAAPMLKYEEDLLNFFRVNHIAKSSVYMKALGVMQTKDLEHFSDKELRSLRLSPSELLEVQNCVLYVKLELGHWRWETALKLLVHYREELRYETASTMGQAGWEEILREVGFSLEAPPDKRSRVPEANRVAVLEAMQKMLQRINLNLVPVRAPRSPDA